MPGAEQQPVFACCGQRRARPARVAPVESAHSRDSADPFAMASEPEPDPRASPMPLDEQRETAGDYGLDCYPYTFSPLLLFAQSQYFDKGYSNYNAVAQFFAPALVGIDMLENVIHGQFQWKNPDFLVKNPDFLMKNVDFLFKNLDL